MLIQIESFPGLLVVSTNLMQGLDQAALRRFDTKIKLDFLRPEQARELLNRHCLALGLPEPESTLHGRVTRIETLTPRDFAVVARHHRFDPIESPAQFVASLERECAVKAIGRKERIGFV